MEYIYLDNSATTAPSEKVIGAAEASLREGYGNPSSRHSLGVAAAREVKAAREACAGFLKVKPTGIIFTAGGSEGNNMAIRSGANGSMGKHIVTTAIEHPSVLRTMEYMEKKGFTVSYVPPEPDGTVALQKIRNALTPKTSLVSVMHVNNETGAVLPVDRVRQVMNEVCPRALFHSDAVQSFGKLPVYPERWGIDLLTFSGHKIHALKGVGGLYMREKLQLAPLILGGGQEGGYRSGTENTLGIISLGTAVGEADLKAAETVGRIKAYLKEAILREIPDTVLNGAGSDSPYVLNISFPGIRSEVFLNALSAKGVYVSSGSACSSNHPSPSHVLTAMGKDKKEVDSAIRFSFSRYNTLEEAERAFAIIRETAAVLRR